MESQHSEITIVFEHVWSRDWNAVPRNSMSVLPCCRAGRSRRRRQASRPWPSGPGAVSPAHPCRRRRQQRPTGEKQISRGMRIKGLSTYRGQRRGRRHRRPGRFPDLTSLLVQNTRRHSISNLQVCLQPPEETGPLAFLRAMLSGEEFAAFEARQAAAAIAAEAGVARRQAGIFSIFFFYFLFSLFSFLFSFFFFIGSQCFSTVPSVASQRCMFSLYVL